MNTRINIHLWDNPEIFSIADKDVQPIIGITHHGGAEINLFFPKESFIGILHTEIHRLEDKIKERDQEGGDETNGND